jgi:flagellar biosynthesis protein FlhF
MKLKTYTAETMAQALAQVRKDLGKDAMILHTRSYRVGAWLGLGGKNMVEITASSPAISSKPRSQRMPVTDSPRQPQRAAADPSPAAQPESEPELVVQRGRMLTRQRLASSVIEAKPQVATPPRSTADAANAGSRPTGPGSNDPRGLNARDALFSAPRENGHSGSGDLPPEPRIGSRTEPRSETRPASRMPSVQHRESLAQPPNRTVPAAAAEPKLPANDENAQLREQLASMQKMMGQVLESTRKTAVAVGSGKDEHSLPSGEMPAPLFALYAQMMDNDVPAELAEKLIGQVRDQLDARELRDPIIVRQALLRAIEGTIRTRSESLLSIDHMSSLGRPRVIALVGPTGVGKTTTVAKLAATYKLRHQKKVGLITSDTYRIAAVEQLKTYAGIIGLPLKVVSSPQEMHEAVEALHDCDIVVVDTAGRSQNDRRRLDELAEFAGAAKPDETHLVLSTTVGDNVLRKTAERFKALGPDRCILTKLDEAVTTGPIAGLCDRIGLPLSFVTVGQEVPDDLEPARVDRLARCVLDGPDAVLRREDEENG